MFYRSFLTASDLHAGHLTAGWMSEREECVAPRYQLETPRLADRGIGSRRLTARSPECPGDIFST